MKNDKTEIIRGKSFNSRYEESVVRVFVTVAI